MKLVLYRDDGEITEVIENCGKVVFDRETETLRYRGGSFWPFKGNFAVLEDDESVDYETILEHHKKDKIDKLNEACEETILAGFYCGANGHYYEFSAYDQMNFTQQYLLLVSNPELTDPIRWKTEDAGVLEHSREEFIAVCEVAEKHKRGNIEKYWELKALVESADTFEEVNAIEWEPYTP